MSITGREVRLVVSMHPTEGVQPMKRARGLIVKLIFISGNNREGKFCG